MTLRESCLHFRPTGRREQMKLWRAQDKARKQALAERMEARLAEKRLETKAWAA